MKRGLLLSIVLFSFATLYAQSDLTFLLNKEGKVVIIPKKVNYEFDIPPYSYRSYTPSSTQRIDLKLKEFIPDIQPVRMDERPMDMQVFSAAYQPFFNVYTPMIHRMSPMALDFNETNIVAINDNFSFLTNGRQYTWPGAGGLTTINGDLVWKKNQWTLSGGAFAGKYFTPFNLSPLLTGGFNISVRYEATEKLALRGWSSYAFYRKEEKYNPHMLWNPFYNHTQVGGALEFKFNENFGIGMGVNYEYNPIRRKMNPQYLIYPIFNSRHIRIGW